MLQGLRKALGWQRWQDCMGTGHLGDIEASVAVPADTNRHQPATSTGGRFSCVPLLQARPAADHAAALLVWLQGAGGRSGSILASELEEIHRELCQEFDWEPIGWVAVGRELRRILGARKEYTRRAGRQLCVYRIPPAV